MNGPADIEETLPQTKPADASQAQVESLVSAVQAEEAATVVTQSGGRKARVKKEDIRPCDFRHPAFLTGAELRKLRLRHEEFIRSLAAHLSIYLRLEVGGLLTKFQAMSFHEFACGLPQPTHLTLFKLEPLVGVCLLDMPLKLGLTFVDRLLGGPAQAVTVNGEPSEIELSLLDQICKLLLDDWCRLWQKVENLRPVLVGYETSGRFLTGSAPDNVMIALAAEVRLGDCVESIQLAFPLPTLEPLLRKAGRGGEVAGSAPAAKTVRPPWNRNLDEVPIRVSTQWQGLEVSARKLAGLKPGDVLPLEPEWLSRVEVLVEQTPKFRARLGTAGDHWAAELTEPAKP
jgi:flagellar motor switch protein FliM